MSASLAPIDILRANVGNLPPRDQEFARSLLAGAASLRGLSNKQWPWVERLANKASAKPANVGDMSGLIALMDTGAENLKRPRVFAQAGDLKVRITIAGPQSRVPGSLMITSAAPVALGERRPFFGRVTRDGTFDAGGDLDPRDTTALLTTLAELAKEPAKAALKYGRLLGACCFCGIDLKDPRSVQMGYGPICAENYGLPWGC